MRKLIFKYICRLTILILALLSSMEAPAQKGRTLKEGVELLIDFFSKSKPRKAISKSIELERARELIEVRKKEIMGDDYNVFYYKNMSIEGYLEHKTRSRILERKSIKIAKKSKTGLDKIFLNSLSFKGKSITNLDIDAFDMDFETSVLMHDIVLDEILILLYRYYDLQKIYKPINFSRYSPSVEKSFKNRTFHKQRFVIKELRKIYKIKKEIIKGKEQKRGYLTDYLISEVNSLESKSANDREFFNSIGINSLNRSIIKSFQTENNLEIKSGYITKETIDFIKNKQESITYLRNEIFIQNKLLGNISNQIIPRENISLLKLESDLVIAKNELENNSKELLGHLQELLYNPKAKDLEGLILEYSEITNIESVVADKQFYYQLGQDANHIYVRSNKGVFRFRLENIELRNKLDGDPDAIIKGVKLFENSNVYTKVEDNLPETLNAIEVFDNWNLTSDEIIPICLTEENATVRVFKKSKWDNKNRIVTSSLSKTKKILEKKMQRHKNKTFVAVGHVVDGNYVDDKSNVSIPISELNFLAKKYNCNILHVACGTSIFQNYSKGTTDIINTYSVAEWIFKVMEKKTNFKDFIISLSNSNIGIKREKVKLLIDNSSFSDKGYAKIKLQSEIIDTVKGTAIIGTFGYIIYKHLETNNDE